MQVRFIHSFIYSLIYSKLKFVKSNKHFVVLWWGEQLSSSLLLVQLCKRSEEEKRGKRKEKNSFGKLKSNLTKKIVGWLTKK